MDSNQYIELLKLCGSIRETQLVNAEKLDTVIVKTEDQGKKLEQIECFIDGCAEDQQGAKVRLDRLEATQTRIKWYEGSLIGGVLALLGLLATSVYGWIAGK